MRFGDILMTAATASIAGSGVDVDLSAWIAAVVANGGTVSGGRATIVGTFITAEKASGAWALTDDYWGLWGENQIQGLTSLKQRRLAVATNSPTFTTDRGYAFNGTTQYVNTGFIPATHAVAMTGTNVRLGVYERTNLAAGTFAAGATNTSSRRMTVTPRAAAGTTGSAEINAQPCTFTLAVADSRGLYVASRNGATVADCVAYQRGVALVRTTNPTVLGVSLPIVALYVGGSDNAGALFSPRASSIGFACTGAALSAAQETAQYNAVQAWATSVGAQV